jgi:hypothetical protein
VGISESSGLAERHESAVISRSYSLHAEGGGELDQKK